MIGIILRDQYGIPLAKTIVGKGIVEILNIHNLTPAIPEDLDSLLRKAARLRAHLERNHSDKYNRRAVQTIESRIRSLSEYYKRKGVISGEWKYVRTSIAVT
jgi:small subunit ribosomal protein S15